MDRLQECLIVLVSNGTMLYIRTYGCRIGSVGVPGFR